MLVKAVQDMLQAMTVVIQGRRTSLTIQICKTPLLQVDSLAFSVSQCHNGILLDVLFFRQAKSDAAMQIWAACRFTRELVSEYGFVQAKCDSMATYTLSTSTRKSSGKTTFHCREL